MRPYLARIKEIIFKWKEPIILLLTCILSYGLLIPWLGLYLDDWYILWSYRIYGPGGFFSFFHEDRPFIAILFWLTSPIMGLNPIAWQVFGLMTRWLTVLAFYWTFCQVWPEARKKVFWAAMLFAVYPGFKQQWISVFYGNSHLLLVTFLLSLGFMVKAVRDVKRYWLWTALGLFFSIYTLFSWEYYFGLDLVRVAILWVILTQVEPKWVKRGLQTLKHWGPYLAAWGGYLIWRAFFFRSVRYDIVLADQLRSAPLQTVFRLMQTAVQDIFTGTWVDWEQIMHAPHALEFNNQTTFLYWGVVVVSAVFIWLALHEKKGIGAMDEKSGPIWGKQAAGIAMFSLLFAGIPYWAAGLQVEVNFPGDRFTMPMILGASLLLCGLIDWLVSTRLQKTILLTIVLALAIGANFQVANTFRRESETLRNFFWQLAWRAPGIKPQTTLLTSDLPFNYFSDTALTSPLNWVYKPEQDTPDLAYLLMNAKTRPASYPALLTPDTEIEKGIRNTRFKGNSSDELAIQFIPPGCLRVLTADDASLPETPGYMMDAAKMSHLNVILPDAETPQIPVTQFGKEPAHTWCYYFEKMDLAGQQQQWQDVITLAEEAQKKGYSPTVVSEWLPLVNAYIQSGQGDKALAASRQAFESDPLIAGRLCTAWQDTPLDKTDQTAITAKQELDCRE